MNSRSVDLGAGSIIFTKLDECLSLGCLYNLARRAEALDERWRSFTRICYEGRVAPVAGRDWFALWEPRAMQGAVAPGCTSAFSDIQRVANDVRDAVAAAGETARQGDVYPGTRREILQRYKLAYAGWDR